MSVFTEKARLAQMAASMDLDAFLEHPVSHQSCWDVPH